MSLAEAGSALGVTLTEPASKECDYVRSPALPDGVSLMVVEDTVARVDVQSGDIATARGVQIGDTEDQVRARYGGDVVTQPQKYTDGHYMIVTPADTMLRLVFETDGNVVTAMRSGRMPQALWIERCS